MNEWIEWKGGKCPVNTSDIVDIKLREFNIHKLANFEEWDCRAGDEKWGHSGRRTDIIAYRLVEKAGGDAAG